MNARKPFGNETPQSTCCGGTGAENHVKYQEAAYFVNDQTMWVGLYLPTVAWWKDKGVTIEQTCKWPAESSTLVVTKTNESKDATFALKLRVPYWATEVFDVKLNGKSIAKSYQPCSYVEIPSRTWQSGDKVEVTMPFTKHINWGPDKMDLAATGKNETRTPFDPQWVGAIMYGPLVMATPDIHEWKDADFTLQSNLSDIQLNGASSNTGKNGNLYTLTLAGKQFQPDYYQTGNATHYLRLNVASAAKAKAKKGIDKTNLEQALQVAKERVDGQNAWNALTVKVPNFSPWAPNGYARLLQQMEAAEKVNTKPNKELTQDEINAATSALNVAINTMRPGNLAEPEDLEPLFETMWEIGRDPQDPALHEAFEYARMVIGYVRDGSGTPDMIRKAIDSINAAKSSSL